MAFHCWPVPIRGYSLYISATTLCQNGVTKGKLRDSWVPLHSDVSLLTNLPSTFIAKQVARKYKLGPLCFHTESAGFSFAWALFSVVQSCAELIDAVEVFGCGFQLLQLKGHGKFLHPFGDPVVVRQILDQADQSRNLRGNLDW